MNDNLDISMKIANFKAMSQVEDDGVALKYLEENEWDEMRAVNQYFSDHSSPNISNTRNENLISRNIIEENHNEGFFGGMLSSIKNFLNPNLLRNEFENTNIYQPRFNERIQNQHEIISDSVTKSPNELLNFLPFKAENLKEFYDTIKVKIGILFIYNSKDLDLIQHVIEEKIFSYPELMLLLENQFVTYSLEDTTKEAKSLISQLKLNNLACLFLYNPFDLEKTNPNILIDRLEGASTIDNLSERIYKSLSVVENSNPHQYIEEDTSHSSIIKRQQDELKHLEREEENKKKQIKLEEEKRRLKEFEERELRERKIWEEKQKEEMALMKKKQLPVEPQPNDPNSCHILFRFPDGFNRTERRFNKTDKIKDLYNYVESLEDVDFNHENKFELVQTFPFIIFSNKEKTLEEEKLFPNAVIQIREIE